MTETQDLNWQTLRFCNTITIKYIPKQTFDIYIPTVVLVNLGEEEEEDVVDIEAIEAIYY